MPLCRTLGASPTPHLWQSKQSWRIHALLCDSSEGSVGGKASTSNSSTALPSRSVSSPASGSGATWQLRHFAWRSSSGRPRWRISGAPETPVSWHMMQSSRSQPSLCTSEVGSIGGKALTRKSSWSTRSSCGISTALEASSR